MDIELASFLDNLGISILENELSTVIPPKELPLKEIFLTEYWININ